MDGEITAHGLLFRNMVKKFIGFLFVCLFISIGTYAQFPPPAGQPGSTAIYKDSSIIIGWATAGSDAERGYINISDTNAQYMENNRATFGSVLYVSGPSDEYVMSLGDGGSVILTFDQPIGNGSGADFAVFENSFSDDFLELAFVEVSSDGKHFVRFPSISAESQTIQVSTFGTSDATKFHNLAGKYRGQYGTPFDLEDLKDSLNINISKITHVKIVDAVGCLQSPFATYDAQGNKVNDPWPTPFDTGGFDLEAVGVIHYGPNATNENDPGSAVMLFPNPASDHISLIFNNNRFVRVTISDLTGRVLSENHFQNTGKFNIAHLREGLYLVIFTLNDGTTFTKKIVKE